MRIKLHKNTPNRKPFMVLRTVDPMNPDGKVVDPVSGIEYESLESATPQGWEEQFRCEYIAGATRAKGFKATVYVFPHEIVLVNPARHRVIPFGSPTRAGDVGTCTSVPAWVTKM